jgi:hypothetical protein
MIGRGDGDGVNIFVFEELANVDEGFRPGHAELLHIAEALVQYAFIDVAQSCKLCSREAGKAADVIIAATAHSANRNADTVIRAENLASKREPSRAYGYCFPSCLEKFAPLDCHVARLCVQAFLHGE